jgi:hypothetical protein
MPSNDHYTHEQLMKIQAAMRSAASDGCRPSAVPVENKYSKIGRELGKLVGEKNAAYGDSFSKSGEVLKILYPNGIDHSQITDVLTITRILDKLFRIATDKDALGESPYNDIAGYCLLAIARKEG